MSGRGGSTRLVLLGLVALPSALALHRPAAAQQVPPHPDPAANPGADPAAAVEPATGRGLLPQRWLYNPRERTTAGIEAWDDERFADADAELGRALALIGDRSAGDPDPLPLLNAGTGRLAAGDPAAAARLLTAAANAADARLETGRGDADLTAAAHYNLGNALFAGGDYAGSAEAFRQALRRAPDHRAAKHNLELALARLEQRQRQGQESGAERGEPGEDEPRDEESESDPQTSPDQPPEPEGEGDQEAGGEPDRREPGEQPPPAEGDGDDPDRDPPAAEDDSTGADSEPEERRLPGFEDQPDMNAEQAASILEAVENLERQRRRQEAARRARRVAGDKDW